MGQVLLHKTIKSITCIIAVPVVKQQVTFVLNFISGDAVQRNTNTMVVV
jgi:hypothetical protein